MNDLTDLTDFTDITDISDDDTNANDISIGQVRRQDINIRMPTGTTFRPLQRKFREYYTAKQRTCKNITHINKIIDLITYHIEEHEQYIYTIPSILDDTLSEIRLECTNLLKGLTVRAYKRNQFNDAYDIFTANVYSLLVIVSQVGHLSIHIIVGLFNLCFDQEFAPSDNISPHIVPIATEYYRKTAQCWKNILHPIKKQNIPLNKLTYHDADILRPIITETYSNIYHQHMGLRKVIFNKDNTSFIVIHCIVKGSHLLYTPPDTAYAHNLIEQNEQNRELFGTYVEHLLNRDKILFAHNYNEIISGFAKLLRLIEEIQKQSIHQIVQEFINLPLERQYYYIYTMAIRDVDNMNYASILYDLLINDQLENIRIQNAFTISTIIHPRLRELIQHSSTLSVKESIKIEQLPIEKRIDLLEVSPTTRQKIIEKLREYQLNKTNETGAKAMTYLSNVLRIPFKKYFKEQIRIDICEYISNATTAVCSWTSTIADWHPLSAPELEWRASLQAFLQLKLTVPTNVETLIANLKLHSLKGNVAKKDWLANIKYTDPTKRNSVTLKQLDLILKEQHGIAYTSIYTIHQQYLEFIAKLEKYMDIYLAKQTAYLTRVDMILENSTYGMTQAKRQIKRLVAQFINGRHQGICIGLEGPPGIGKTIFAKNAISQALDGRPIIFVAIGGSSNGSTLEGHNYTYVGATWGKIVDGIMDAQCMNPIIYIDEVDKISKTEQGREIIGILTHITDPSQNMEFYDKYFQGIPIDLSKTIFVFSYNNVENVDSILLDRIHRIHLDPYTVGDKLQIINRFIVPEIYQNVGISNQHILCPNTIIEYIINTWTNEAGMRHIKDLMYELYRECNVLIMSRNSTLTSSTLINKKTILPITITREFVDNMFKLYPKHIPTLPPNKPMIGLICGLFATSLGGGGLLHIQATRNYSAKDYELLLTGSQGNTMQESMKVARTVALQLAHERGDMALIESKNHHKHGIHIHLPDLSQPKDGPSATAVVIICIYSLLTDRPINNKMAMTGEVDLQGNILAIGGLEHKLYNAKIAGIKYVVIPERNKDDLAKIKDKYPDLIGDDFVIHTVSKIEEAFDYCFDLTG